MIKTLLTASILSFFINIAQAEDIGLKISADENWLAWGDYILGKDLQTGFEDLGYSVQPAYIGNYYPAGHENSTIDVYMHGFIPFNPPLDTHKKKVLYLYYPLETANSHKYKNIKNIKEPDWLSLQTELWDFDLIAVASPTYLKELKHLGIKTIFTPQFTNPKKFFYEYSPEVAYDILFVGRPGYERLSAKWAIESGFDVALFGSGWQNQAPLKFFKGDYIDNNELHKYYSSAKIVLNDTREDMKRAGFISNRVFDVTASGGFLITDYMPEIEMFYGDSIPMFKTKEELKELIDYYLSHPEERTKKAKLAQHITLTQFTNKIIAQNILKALEEENDVTEKIIMQLPYDKDFTFVGDYWLAQDLAKGLKENNIDIKQDFYDTQFHRDTFYQEAQNILYMQFKTNQIDFEENSKNKIMYFYFPIFIPDRGKFKNTPDTFTYNTHAFLNNELEAFDLIATPAKATLDELKKHGYKAEFVPQFTNSDKFKPTIADEQLKTDLLFIGSVWYERESVKYALENGYDIDVYGLNWKGKIPDKYIKGEFVDNNDLPRYYSSAKIVLSDHAEDLEEMGLVANRLYDVTASGAFVISEYSPYIEEIFGDSIPMFHNKEDFKELVDYYLAHPEERLKKAHQAQQITLNGYTHRHIGQKFKQLFQHLKEVKK